MPESLHLLKFVVVKLLCAAFGWTISDLAAVANVSTDSASQYRRGTRYPSDDVLDGLTRILQTRPSSLLSRAEDELHQAKDNIYSLDVRLKGAGRGGHHWFTLFFGSDLRTEQEQLRYVIGFFDRGAKEEFKDYVRRLSAIHCIGVRLTQEHPGSSPGTPAVGAERILIRILSGGHSGRRDVCRTAICEAWDDLRGMWPELFEPRLHPGLKLVGNMMAR